LFTPDSLVYRLIVHVKQHRKLTSEKSITVLMKTLDKLLLKPKYNFADLRRELQKALDSEVVLSTLLSQQHSEQDIRECFAKLVSAINNLPPQ
jgi:hypothetical protein